MNEEYEDDTQDSPRQLSRQLDSASQMPAGMMLMKLENESIMSIARTAPRDQAKIVKQLIELIDAYPAAADEAIYKKPVGSVTEGICAKCGKKYEVPYKGAPECPRCQCPDLASRKKVTKFAEGLSIRAAESIRSIYGFSRLAVTTEVLPDDKVKITGIFVDYCAGNFTSDDRVVSPWYRSRNGGMERTPEDRFLNVVVKAEKAKLRRDVILDSIPNITKAAFRDACEKKLAAIMTPELVETTVNWFNTTYGITAVELEKVLGRPQSMGWTEEDRVTLKQLANALKNEETTVADIRYSIADDGGDPSKAGQAKNGAASGTAPGASGTVSGSDLTKKKETPPESKGEAQGETYSAPTETKPTASETAAQAEAAARFEAFDLKCREEYKAEFEVINSQATSPALTKVWQGIDKNEDYSAEVKAVFKNWIGSRREALKGKGGQKQLV